LFRGVFNFPDSESRHPHYEVVPTWRRQRVRPGTFCINRKLLLFSFLLFSRSFPLPLNKTSLSVDSRFVLPPPFCFPGHLFFVPFTVNVLVFFFFTFFLLFSRPICRFLVGKAESFLTPTRVKVYLRFLRIFRTTEVACVFGRGMTPLIRFFFTVLEKGGFVRDVFPVLKVVPLLFFLLFSYWMLRPSGCSFRSVGFAGSRCLFVLPLLMAIMFSKKKIWPAVLASYLLLLDSPSAFLILSLFLLITDGHVVASSICFSVRALLELLVF